MSNNVERCKQLLEEEKYDELLRDGSIVWDHRCFEMCMKACRKGKCYKRGLEIAAYAKHQGWVNQSRSIHFIEYFNKRAYQ